MLTRCFSLSTSSTLGALLVVASLSLGAARAAPPQRVYAVRWAQAGDGSPEQRALVAQADAAVRDELRRRGAVIAAPRSRDAIVLTLSLEVQPASLRLRMVGVREQALLGTTSSKASGASREAQLRAVVRQACIEAEALQ